MVTEYKKTIKPAGQGGDYTSLAAWQAGEAQNLIVNDRYAIAEIDGDWTGISDTTPVTIDGWTTDVTHYIKIYTTPSARHTGKWDITKYRLEINNTAWDYAPLRINNPFTTVYGLQILSSSNSNSSVSGILTDIYQSKIGYCIIKAGTSPYKVNGIYCNNYYATNYYFNNIVYGFTNGINVGGVSTNETTYMYNNTIHSCTTGINGSYNTIKIAKNNLIKSCINPATGTFAAGTDYNSTNNASIGYTVTGSGNIHDRLSQTFSFVNEGSMDLHLTSTDTGAKGYGTNLSGDINLPFNDDIDGNIRTVPWSIGADQTVSLCPNIAITFNVS